MKKPNRTILISSHFFPETVWLKQWGTGKIPLPCHYIFTLLRFLFSGFAACTSGTVRCW